MTAADVSQSRSGAATGDAIVRPDLAVRPDLSGPPGGPADLPRPIGRATWDDRLALWGSLAGSFGLVFVGYYRLLPFSGLIGFVVCWYLVFVALYVGVSVITLPGTLVRDRLAAVLIHGAAGLVLIAVLSAIVFTFTEGRHAIVHLNFYTHDMAGVAPTAPLTQGGILHAIVGTLIEIGIAIVVALPLGVGTAVFITEVGGRFSRGVRTVVEAMTALPDILAGLFIYTTLIVRLGVQESGFAAGMALTVMMLPIIARSSEVSLRVVPGGLREAGLALGASRWRTVWHVVLPTARQGLATALILGIARGIGETAPVLLTSGASTFFNANPFNDPMNSLPLFIFAGFSSGEKLYTERIWGAASVLLGVVLILFITARVVARSRPGRS
jgi:phosphate transport system permease protein